MNATGKKILEHQLQQLQQKMPELYDKLMDQLEEAKLIKKAMIEAAETRTAPMVLDPNRNYKKEIKDLIAERMKGTVDPTIFLKDGELVAKFEDLGPRFKIAIRGPFRRLKSNTGPLKRGGRAKKVEG